MLRRLVQLGILALLLAAAAFAFAAVTADGASRWLAAAALALILIVVGGILVNGLIPPPGPPINDVTTDPDDPPAFEAVTEKRPRHANPAEHGGPPAAARQRAAYPQLRPIRTSLPPCLAFERAVGTGEAMGWEIVTQNAAEGVIEAVAVTAFFRFRDDVVVRVRADEEGSRVDLRSLSRVGRSDLGKNAARIIEFQKRFAADRARRPDRDARANEE